MKKFAMSGNVVISLQIYLVWILPVAQDIYQALKPC